jgi:ribosomal protein S13
MKKFLVLGCCAWLALTGFAAESFVGQLTPEERHAAGLDQLTPEQQRALDALAARFVTEGARVTEARVREETKAEVAKVREAIKTQVEAEVQQREAAQIGLADPKKESRGIESRIVGPFKGWNGRTLFKLENGQQWVQTDGQVYVVSSQPGPDVEIVPSALGGWKLWIQPAGRWIRVKRIN